MVQAANHVARTAMSVQLHHQHPVLLAHRATLILEETAAPLLNFGMSQAANLVARTAMSVQPDHQQPVLHAHRVIQILAETAAPLEIYG